MSQSMAWDHGVVHRAAAERPDARIPDALPLTIVFAVALFPIGVGVVVHEIVPAAPAVFTAEPMEHRSGVKKTAGVIRLHQVAAGLDEENLVSAPSQVCRQRASAGAGSNNDVVCVSHVHAPRRDLGA